MGGATPHGGVEPSVGPKTVVVGFPRVVVECLLALAELARRKAAAVEGMNLDKVGKAEASKPPRALHADRPADASLESLHSLSKVVGTHKAPHYYTLLVRVQYWYSLYCTVYIVQYIIL